MEVLNVLSKTEMSSSADIALNANAIHSDVQDVLDDLEGARVVRRLASKEGKTIFYELSEKGIEVFRPWMKVANELVGGPPFPQLIVNYGRPAGWWKTQALNG